MMKRLASDEGCELEPIDIQRTIGGAICQGIPTFFRAPHVTRLSTK